MERSDGVADTYNDGEYSLCDDQLVTMLVDAGIGRDDIAAVQHGLNVLWSADGSNPAAHWQDKAVGSALGETCTALATQAQEAEPLVELLFPCFSL